MWRLFLVSLSCLLSLAGGYVFYERSVTKSGRVPDRPILLTSGEDAGYVDASRCATCHSAIWETFRRTGMGRSFARVRPEASETYFAGESRFYHKLSDQHYRTFRRDGKLFQRRHQIGFGGRETNVVEKEIHFVVGSGNHVRTYLHQAPDGRIYELPVGWYAEKGGYWAMNPGYDRPDHDNFRRQLNGQCMFCHNGYPEIEKGADRSGTAPVFRGFVPEGIDCQRCHGPGRAHIEAMQAGNGSPDARQSTIVNPARLSVERQLDLCMQCHLETTSFRLPQGIVRYSRGILSYRPGEPLTDYMLYFDHPPGAGHDDKFEIASAAYRLRKSACFLKSDGAMRCTTCHNPHDIPRGAAADRHYAAACRTCHAATLEKLATKKAHPVSEDCGGCHMPKRRTDDVIHAVMTDHYIQRLKPARDLLAPRDERRETDATAYKGEVALYYPPKPSDTESELYLAVAQVRQGANLRRGIPRLEKLLQQSSPRQGEFFFELGEAYSKVQQIDKAIGAYEEALKRSPEFRPAVQKLGTALAKAGRLDQAVQIMQKALAAAPGDPTILNDLALVYLGQGKRLEAVEALRRALQIDPDLADAHNNLGGALSLAGDRAGAEEAFRTAIRIQPDLASAHKNLAGLLADRGDFAEAEYCYRQAIQSLPKFEAAHYEFARALAQQDRYRDAAVEFEAVVRLNPSSAEAHTGLGDMSALLGDANKAVRHYKRAIELKPDLAAASFALGSALAAMGNRVEAMRHLENASRGTDSEVRRAAQEAVRALQGGARSPSR